MACLLPVMPTGEVSLIAIIEDDVPQGKALARLLSAEGFATAIFHSAEAYLDAARVTAPHCLIVDFRLPGMTGLELIARLQQAGAAPPIIVTTSAPETVRERAKRLGALAVFPKPTDADTLLAALAAIADGGEGTVPERSRMEGPDGTVGAALRSID